MSQSTTPEQTCGGCKWFKVDTSIESVIVGDCGWKDQNRKFIQLPLAVVDIVLRPVFEDYRNCPTWEAKDGK